MTKRRTKIELFSDWNLEDLKDKVNSFIRKIENEKSYVTIKDIKINNSSNTFDHYTSSCLVVIALVLYEYTETNETITLLKEKEIDGSKDEIKRPT